MGDRRRSQCAPLALRLLILTLTLTSCARGEADGDPAESERLLVLAAASLDAAMPELLAAFEARNGTEADLVLAATGTLAAQVANGAPADILFAADDHTISRLMAAALIEPGTRAIYGLGRLAIVVSDRNGPAPALSALGDPRFAVIAIANPEHAPYGQAAVEALKRAGVWPTVRPRLVYAENVSQTLHFVLSGNADAAIVAASLASSTGAGRTALIDPAMHPPIRHELGVLAASANPQAAALARFATGIEGQAILARHGFDPPQGK